MSFPISLSPSPVQEAFPGIEWDPVGKLELSDPERALLRAGEDKPIEYILADQHDAEAYTRILLKVIDQGMRSPKKAAGSSSQQQPRRVSQLALDQAPLPDDEALQYLYADSMGVVLHYAISKLCQVIQELKSSSSTASTTTRSSNTTTNSRATPKVTLATIFYPSGILVEDWRPLWRMLSGSLSDPYAQRGAAYCLACILLTGCDTLRDHWGSSSNGADGAVVIPSLNPILESFVSWMTSRLASARPSDKTSLSSVTPSLVVLLANAQARKAFDAAGGVGYLSRHLCVASRSRATVSRNTSSDSLMLNNNSPSHNNRRSRGGVGRHHSNNSLGGGGPGGGVGGRQYSNSSLGHSPGVSRQYSNNSLGGRSSSPGGSPASLNVGGGMSSSSTGGMMTNGSKSSSSGASVQQLYELTYSLWLLSYDCVQNKRLRKHFLRDGAVPKLCELVVAAPREKVVRLALSTLCNLAVLPTMPDSNSNEQQGAADGEHDAFQREIHACGLLEPLERMLKDKKWSDDPDLLQDLQTLVRVLRDTFHHMTRWDVYQAEVESSYLQWGIVHTEKFFRDNAVRMEGKDGKFAIVRTLIKLAASEDEEVAAIACFDIGEFARHYPAGRSLAKRLGARDVVLSLIEHDNPELQHQALVSVSKMLVLNWKAVS